jgi:hypothetical protein
MYRSFKGECPLNVRTPPVIVVLGCALFPHPAFLVYRILLHQLIVNGFFKNAVMDTRLSFLQQALFSGQVYIV